MADNPTVAYDFVLRTLTQQPLPLENFRGKPIVVVNTASKCGLTPQYTALQALWQEFRNDGLVVLGVPCNDFGKQEPGDAAAISAFCAGNYGVDFPLTEKMHVRGPEIAPFYRWLTRDLGFFGKPRWNFHKYLIGRDGRVSDWFASSTKPTAARFRRAVQNLLKAD